MTDDNTYNGWTNRATWCVNLHWGDYWQALVDEGEEISADTMRSDVDALLDEAFAMLPEGARLFIQDMMSSDINWHELARHYAPAESD